MSRDTWTIYVCNECHQMSLDCDCKCGSDGDFPEVNEVRVVSVQALHDWIRENEVRITTGEGCGVIDSDELRARFPLTDKENPDG